MFSLRSSFVALLNWIAAAAIGLFVMLPDDDAQDSPLKFFTLVQTAAPVNVSAAIGSDAVFTATFQSNAPFTVTYVWQMLMGPVANDTWQNLEETPGYYEGVATTTLTVKAVDNFLASLTSRKFRLKATYPQFPAAYSTAATLTIPRSVSFVFGALTYGARSDGGLSVTTGPAPTIQATGFSGPFTYLWAKVAGGDPTTCSNTAIANPTFTLLCPGYNVYPSRWTCTVSNGSVSVTSDPFLIAFACSAGPGSTPTASGFFPTSSAVGAVVANSPTQNLFSTWETQNCRWGPTTGVSFNTTTSLVQIFAPVLPVGSQVKAGAALFFPVYGDATLYGTPVLYTGFASNYPAITADNAAGVLFCFDR